MSKYTFILRGKLKFAFAALLAIGFLVAHPTFEVSAKTKRAKYGTIKILTTPGGLLLMIDGKSHGETRTEYRAFDLEPGSHNVEIRLPNGQFWKREIEVPAAPGIHRLRIHRAAEFVSGFRRAGAGFL